MRKPPLQDVIVRGSDTPRHSGVRRTPEREPHQFREEDDRRYEREKFDDVDGVSSYERHDTEQEEPLHERRGHKRTHSPLTHPSFRESNTSKKWIAIALGIGAIVVLSSVTLSLLFAGATVTVYPMQESVTVDAELTVSTTEEGEGILHIEKTVMEKIAAKEVVALGEEEVEERASGNITIYNEYSETAQRIIKNTRFKTPEGLIFRVSSSVEIPGKKTDGTPGSVEVTVQAEEPGEEYNIGATTFTIPGYEESGLTTHFEKIYAKSTEGMTGGFDGIRRSVNEEDRQVAITELKTQLRDELRAQLLESPDMPEGYKIFNDAVFFEFDEQSDVPVGTDKVSVSVKGKLHGLLFPLDAFEKMLAEQTMAAYTGIPIYIDNIDELSVALVSDENEESVQPWNADTYTVMVQGKAHFIWEFDEDALKSDFAGKDKEILTTPNQGDILQAHPGIDKLGVSVRPFWKGSFPESTDDIVVITELDENTTF